MISNGNANSSSRLDPACAEGSSRSRLLGLIVPELVNSCVTQFFRQFEDAAFMEGYDLFIGTVNSSNGGPEVLVRHMIQYGVDGVAILTDSVERRLLDLFLQQGIRLLLLKPAEGDPQIDTIGLDMRYCADQAVQHLAVLGHRNIVFAHDPSSGFLQIPPDAFSIAMSSIGIKVECDHILQHSGAGDDGSSALRSLLERKAIPTAIVCSSDIVALKLQKAIYTRGLKVPVDMSITGFGDVSLAQYANPPLTTIQVSQSDLAACALGFLRALQSRGQDRQSGGRRIGASLIARQSTSFPRKSIQLHKRHADRSARRELGSTSR